MSVLGGIVKIAASVVALAFGAKKGKAGVKNIKDKITTKKQSYDICTERERTYRSLNRNC